MALRFTVCMATSGRAALGVFSLYKIIYNSKLLYGRKITSLCLQRNDVLVTCHHPFSILCYNQIQHFPFVSITSKEKKPSPYHREFLK